MRTIKFRVWDGSTMESFVFDDDFDCEIGWLESPRVLMQFTGLKDKNGKEIYEGDICRFDSDKTSDIVFNDGEFQNRLSQWGLHVYMKCPYTGEQKTPGIEVIGNIHENPDLISSKNTDSDR